MLNFGSDATKVSASLFAVLFALGLLVGGIGTYYVNTLQVSNLNKQVTDLQSQVIRLNDPQNQNVTSQSITIYQNGTALVEIYAKVSDSVVLIHGTSNGTGIRASGFVYNYSGNLVVLTNFHVVQDANDLSVTFSNGNGYAATVLGTDPYADLAVVSVQAPAEELKPLQIVSSSSLHIGDQVIAIGNPYGLVGSLTTGVVSALGRSEPSNLTPNFAIANMIQTSTPINPGNSGGPLLNAAGQVVGITNSAISNSQGVVFAVPSNTILREISSLVTTGSYSSHSYLGISSYFNRSDMSYDLAQELKVNVTYGRYVGETAPGGPSDGKLQSGDIIIAMNGTKIRNSADLGSYLEEKTLPSDLLVITVVRNNTNTDVNVTLGTRPQPNL